MAQPTEPIRVLVVDDEAPARQRLIDLLEKDPQVGSVLEAANGKAAVEIIEREALDLVFLDVQMPELDGLQVLETVGAAAMPLTVFVTAYDKHAIRAFEANALDYLLKPFSDERWEAALAAPSLGAVRPVCMNLAAEFYACWPRGRRPSATWIALP
ncbi:MAG TPA: response regulator [Candidatus Acidoferrum sp.]